MDHYKFFQNTQCEYFPCHKGVPEEEFNCLFCYCPLYALGDRCGGDFVYKNGVKVCTGCTKPHRPGGYEYIMSHIKEVMKLAEKNHKTYGNIRWLKNGAPECGPFFPAFGSDVAERVAAFHRTVPGYCPTPLTSLSTLAHRLHVKNIYIKDESFRFGLKAFKALGGAYAAASVLADRLGMSEVDFEKVSSPEARQKLGKLTFITTTDGNHGKGVAWAARMLGHKAVVYMPKGSAPSRVQAIEKQGAEVTVSEMNYDDTVRFTRRLADEMGWILLQDTVLEDYHEIPLLISQGYITLIEETFRSINEQNLHPPTHVFLQAGVGSMAGAVQGWLCETFGDKAPKTVIMEPHAADCFYQSAVNNEPRKALGGLGSMMAGLDCGEVNVDAWDILRKTAWGFITCPDYVSALGMRILANPYPGDTKIYSGESAAVGPGLLAMLMKDPELENIRKEAELDENSNVLFLNTEGITDPQNYCHVLCGGKLPLPEGKEGILDD